MTAGPRQAVRPFIERLRPASVDGGFRMERYWIWCASVTRGDDGRFHMFASRWPRALRFAPHWLTNSEVVRAIAERPEGPYEFAEVVLPARGAGYWDGRMTHNPTIHRIGDTYLLFYTGSTFTGPTPTPDSQVRARMPIVAEARANQRIGLATANSLNGPWVRSDEPILGPRPGKWDSLMTTNPAPCVLSDGGVLLVYKSTQGPDDLLRMGVARSKRPEGPYERVIDDQLLHFADPHDHVEDAYVWSEAGQFKLLMKDMNGGISGEKGAGVFASSRDGVRWRLTNPPIAYSLTIKFANGHSRTFARVERPQLLIDDGKPRTLFLAVGESEAAGPRLTRSWSQAIPLAG